jgi:uncharacterized protein YecE (DUF72 family)
MHPIRLGSCGWSYQEWVGTFYPPGTPASEFLSVYAERYAVVEVDSTFYRPPGKKMAAAWRGKTPADFGFCLKVPQIITHEKRLLDCADDVAEFLTGARVLRDKLRCCVLQFGYFNRWHFAGLGPFLERLVPFLEEWPADVPLAVEIRNKAWLTPRLADALRPHGAVLVLTDQAWMPSPQTVLKQFDVVTGPFAYLRLLGDRAETERRTRTFDHLVLDRTDQVQADAEAMRLLAARVPVLAFVNNHFAGYAPGSIAQLEAALGIPASRPEASTTVQKSLFPD